MWYRNALARQRAEVILARQRLMPKRPKASVSGKHLPPMSKQTLWTLLAGGFAATMVLGPTRTLKLATRGATLAGMLLPARGTTGAPPSPHAPSTHTRPVHLNGKSPAPPVASPAQYSETN